MPKDHTDLGDFLDGPCAGTSIQAVELRTKVASIIEFEFAISGPSASVAPVAMSFAIEAELKVAVSC
jgi:hypothetical protein